MDIQVLANFLSPLLVFVAVVGGWVLGKRKQVAEVDSLTVGASKVAVDALLSTVQPLKDEIAHLKSEVDELRRLNQKLIAENRDLASAISQLRRYVSEVDDHPPYFRDPAFKKPEARHPVPGESPP